MKKKSLRFLSLALSAVTAFTFAGVAAPTTVRAAGEPIAINATNFPGEGFRTAISTAVDTDKNGSLSADEIAAVTSLNIYNYYYYYDDATAPEVSADLYEGGYLSISGADDITGFEYLTSIDNLYMNNVSNTSLDFTSLKDLGFLYIENCYSLSSIDVSNLNKLKDLTIYYTSLKSLDVTTNKSIEAVRCSGNYEFSSFKAGENNKKLSGVYVYGPNLKSLNLSKLKALTGVAISDCSLNLNKIGIKNKSKIKELCINYNRNSGFNPTEYPNLQILEYSGNGASKLDLSKNTKLIRLQVNDNKLRSLDLSNNTKLDFINASYNSLDKLDVTKCKKLSYINISSNDISKMDLSKNKNLYTFMAYDNSFKEVDFSKNKSIGYIEIGKNTKITLPKDKYSCSYYDYSKDKYVAKNVKGNTFQPSKVFETYSYYYFEGNSHYICAYFYEY